MLHLSGIHRLRIACLAASAAWALAGAASAAAAWPAVCQWGGTAVNPTGWFTINPGVTNVPLVQASAFKATGQLAGSDPRCRGKLTFTGQVDAGSICPMLSFEGTVKGLPGVAYFWGKGSLLIHENLYDAQGDLVGSDQPVPGPPDGHDPFYDCDQPEGLTANSFSSTIELYR